jgi:23S rRNA pseudouridine2604 synthase
VVVEEPQHRVLDQKVELDPEASLLELTPVTLLLNKPAGYEAGLDAGAGRPASPALQLLVAGNQAKDDRSGIRPLKKHFSALTLATPLATPASGLVVFTQDWRVARKLSEDASVMEHEVIVDVAGTIAPGGLQRLNRIDHGFTFKGLLLPPAKVSWQNEIRLRFALKGEHPGQIAFMCESVGLSVQAMKRIRVGRVPMSSLPVGQWRYLQPPERF